MLWLRVKPQSEHVSAHHQTQARTHTHTHLAAKREDDAVG